MQVSIITGKLFQIVCMEMRVKVEFCRQWSTKIDNAIQKLQPVSLIRQYGRLVKASGLVLEAVGLKLPLGSNCFVERQLEGKIQAVECEVIGFNGKTLYLMPFESTDGILLDARVYTSQYDLTHFSHKVLPIGIGLLGRVVDAMGKPLDGKPLPEHIEFEGLILSLIHISEPTRPY